MAGLITAAGIISGRLVISLDSGEMIDVGVVQGPQGLTGDRGPMGNTGRPGADGNTILHSAGRPRPDLGRDGDFHINTRDWEISGKENGRWGAPQPLLVDGSKLGGLDQGGKTIKGGPGRFFPMGGASSSVSAPATSDGGLEKIIGNGQPLGANIWSPIAIDADGDLMEVTLYFQRAGGNEVYVCKVVAFRANTLGNLTIAWEAAVPDTMTHTVEFDAPVIGTELTLRVRSSTNWEQIRGVVSKL